MTIAEMIFMGSVLAIAIAYEVKTRRSDKREADAFEYQIFKQYEAIQTFLEAKANSDGGANKAILDAIGRRNCEVFTIKNKLEGLDKTFTYRGYIRRLLRVRNSWQNGTLSDAEAMKKISDMLAEIREKEKIE